MVVKCSTVSLRHKHSPETLIIHINQCIHIVLVFTSNARQLIIHFKTFLSTKISFLKISFFCSKILSHFIKFYFIWFLKKKKFFFSKVLFMDYCSRITVHGLLLVTIQKLYCNTICLLHYYLAIQFSNFLPLQYTLVYCNTISILFASPLYCNIMLQYNFLLLLQYNH